MIEPSCCRKRLGKERKEAGSSGKGLIIGSEESGWPCLGLGCKMERGLMMGHYQLDSWSRISTFQQEARSSSSAPPLSLAWGEKKKRKSEASLFFHFSLLLTYGVKLLSSPPLPIKEGAVWGTQLTMLTTLREHLLQDEMGSPVNT